MRGLLRVPLPLAAVIGAGSAECYGTAVAGLGRQRARMSWARAVASKVAGCGMCCWAAPCGLCERMRRSVSVASEYASSSACLSTLRVSSVPGLHVRLQNGKAHEMCACVGTHSHVRERVHDTVDFSNPKELEALKENTRKHSCAHTPKHECIPAHIHGRTCSEIGALSECVRDSDR